MDLCTYLWTLLKLLNAKPIGSRVRFQPPLSIGGDLSKTCLTIKTKSPSNVPLTQQIIIRLHDIKISQVEEYFNYDFYLRYTIISLVFYTT